MHSTSKAKMQKLKKESAVNYSPKAATAENEIEEIAFSFTISIYIPFDFFSVATRIGERKFDEV